MRRVIKIVALVLVALIVAGLGVYVWASFAASRKLSRTYTRSYGGLPDLVSDP